MRYRLRTLMVLLSSGGLFLLGLVAGIRLRWWDEAVQQLRERLQLGDGPMLGFNIRDLLWFLLVAVLVVVWLVDRRQLFRERRNG
jgi:hypothetical protein